MITPFTRQKLPKVPHARSMAKIDELTYLRPPTILSIKPPLRNRLVSGSRLERVLGLCARLLLRLSEERGTNLGNDLAAYEQALPGVGAVAAEPLAGDTGRVHSVGEVHVRVSVATYPNSNDLA